MEQKKYEYTYDASRQSEIQKIREKYTQKEPNKLEELRRLDAGVTAKAMARALAVGILGTLVAGAGMSLCLVLEQFAVGIPVGIAGVAAASIAYPVYTRTLQKGRAKIAPDILRLSDELLK